MAEPRPEGPPATERGGLGRAPAQEAHLGSLSDRPEESRPLAAGLLAAATFVAVFAGGLLAGYELYDRLLRGSTFALVVLLLIFAVAGAYGGWLLGLIVFAAARGRPEQES